MEKFQLIYPECKAVTAETLMTWAEDAYDNGETDRLPEDVYHAIEILESAGHITTTAHRQNREALMALADECRYEEANDL